MAASYHGRLEVGNDSTIARRHDELGSSPCGECRIHPHLPRSHHTTTNPAPLCITDLPPPPFLRRQHTVNWCLHTARTTRTSHASPSPMCTQCPCCRDACAGGEGTGWVGVCGGGDGGWEEGFTDPQPYTDDDDDDAHMSSRHGRYAYANRSMSAAAMTCNMGEDTRVDPAPWRGLQRQAAAMDVDNPGDGSDNTTMTSPRWFPPPSLHTTPTSLSSASNTSSASGGNSDDDDDTDATSTATTSFYTYNHNFHTISPRTQYPHADTLTHGTLSGRVAWPSVSGALHASSSSYGGYGGVLGQ